jgi:hypothetical protein
MASESDDPQAECEDAQLVLYFNVAWSLMQILVAIVNLTVVSYTGVCVNENV